MSISMRQQGKIKWFRTGKGYGFIAPLDGSPDAFLHIKVCQSCRYEPRTGDLVEFDAAETQTGVKVVWVEKVSG